MSAVLLCSCGDKDEFAAESAPAETTVTIIPCSITSSDSSDYRPAPLEGGQKERVEKKITERSELVWKETGTQNLDLKFF